VDDHQDTCELVELALDLYGIDVVWTTDALQGLQFLMEGQIFDAILLDADMPIVDGWEFLRRVRDDSTAFATPVIMVSAHAFADVRQRAIDAGCARFIAKPCLPEALADAVREVVFSAR
jgi:two-component system cell cycle response regulator DivK